MIKPSRVALRLRHHCAALMLAGIIILAVAPVHAQQPAAANAAKRNNPAVATDGATLIHGNYCGSGNRPGKPPIDALDLACMNHDACTPPSGIPNCDCNERLRDEAAAVSQDPRQAPELRSLASLTAAAATVMICKPMLDAAVPQAPATVAPVATAPAAAAPTRIDPAPVPPAPVAGAPVSIVPESVASAPEAPATTAPATATPVTSAPVTSAPVTSTQVTVTPLPASVEPKARSLP